MSPLLLLGLLFVAIIAMSMLVLGLVLRRRTNADERMLQFTGGAPVVETPDIKARINDAVSKTSRGSNIARDLARADLKLTAGEFVMLKVIAAVGMGVVGAWLATQATGAATPLILLGGGLFGAVIGSFFPNVYVNFRSKRRVRAFNNQLADTIAMLASSLRSGYSLLQSMDLVSREARPPMASEMRRLVQEVGLGMSTEAALGNLLRRVPSDDLDLMITAINIQHEVGGNLAQILEGISHTIRERVRIKGEIRAITSMQRGSGYVITALPIFLAVMLSTINPGYMAPIFTFGLPPKAWCCFPVTCLVMIGIAYVIIMKIVDIDI
ncbi:MAG: Flp pilus assembly protein TadB [uncultured Chloroflexia bacterium]|uniref:Flp pilus assembly protein TadB n=1 Tax=uncultured Chloroflexia bacterium TaxID=1672391 RepID=A0A6J4KYG5_9CHLR|nr:MAG: Flp pilus assembly protein TadB [uncultured Chloroflexia bacterium]